MMHWFLTNVWPTMFHTLIAAMTGAIAAVIVVAPIKKGLHSMGKRLSAAIDSLDPDVPVGLTKQLDNMEQELTRLNTHVTGTLNVRPVKDNAPLVRHGH